MKVLIVLGLLAGNLTSAFVFNGTVGHALEITWFQGLALLAYHLTES